jgi:dihydrofolate reductase
LIISAIAAIGEGGVIGREGRLPWHLPDDLKRFRAITWGKPIIMGRRTFESLGRPLPGRTNIVLTRTPDYRAEGCVVAGTPEEALAAAASTGAEEAVVIGGSEVYRELLPLCEKVYLTIVGGHFEGDAFFPAGVLEAADWDVIQDEHRMADSRNSFDTRYQIRIRRTPTTGHGSVSSPSR